MTKNGNRSPGTLQITGWAGHAVVCLLMVVSLLMATEPGWITFYTIAAIGLSLALVIDVMLWFVRAKNRQKTPHK